jgi:hypothetical protein
LQLDTNPFFLPQWVHLNIDELTEDMPKTITRRDIQKSLMNKLIAMDRNEAVKKLGRQYFPDLIPSNPCPKSQELQWKAIRDSFQAAGIEGGLRYTLLHACAEYGHHQLLDVLLELAPDANINRYIDGQVDVPLARAIIGHENGMRVPASISRILLERGAGLGYFVQKKGVYASDQTRSEHRFLYHWATDGFWPWPETEAHAIELGKKQGGATWKRY